jgi:hypothetical protein
MPCAHPRSGTASGTGITVDLTHVLIDEQKFIDGFAGEAWHKSRRWRTPTILLFSKLESCMLKLTDQAQ